MSKIIKVVEQLAHGGFGKVEKVQYGKATAVRKTFDPTIDVLRETTMEKLLKRFRREVSVQSSLSEEYFIPILESDLSGADPWFVMPVADCTYTEKIKQDRGKEIDFDALADILNSLDELHSMGFVHRDLKPSNILLHEGHWKLSDFGLITPAPGEASRVTSTGSNWGTYGYKAPEQAKAFSHVKATADIYSFGCILHDFTGEDRVPFQRYSCGGPFGAVIEKCTEIIPRKRFQSITAVRNAILSLGTKQKLGELSEKTEDWIEKLGELEAGSWDEKTCESFLRFLRNEGEQEAHGVLVNFHIPHIQSLRRSDSDRWSEFVEYFCEWARRSSHNFEFCDVLANRLEAIYDLGDTAEQAAVCVALAEMAQSHNRWYAMRVLCKLCGKNCEDGLAKRIRIEILAGEGNAECFSACATSIGRSHSTYHPTIAEALSDGD